MASSVETGLELKLGTWRGCTAWEDQPFHVETVAEAHAAILQYAMDALGHHAHGLNKREHLRLKVRADGPTWDDLAKCQENRRYDPSKPEDGMKCSYFLYQQGGIEGVGGVRWTYAVTIWATAPPEVWNHPANQPIDLDKADDRGNDSESNLNK